MNNLEHNDPGVSDLMRTMEQSRASHAWKQVDGLEQSVREGYRDLVRGFPSMIQTNGLGQALAFLASKIKEDSHKCLLAHLTEWLCNTRDVPGFPVYGDTTPPQENENRDRLRLLIRLSDGDSVLLRRATLEALAFIVWLKRFSEAQEAIVSLNQHEAQEEGNG